MRITLPLLASLALTACATSFNDTTGADYLAARDAGQIDPEIAAAADIGGQLSFPARIAVARLVYGDLTTTPAAEAELWDGLIQQTRGFGQVVPLTRLSAALGPGPNRINGQELREMAAAQQFDYLLITDLDPGAGTAQSAFIDVRTGFTYATSSAASPSGGQRGFWGGEIRNTGRLDRATYDLAQVLMPDIEEMLRGLAARAN